jgi:hypothetical protein
VAGLLGLAIELVTEASQVLMNLSRDTDRAVLLQGAGSVGRTQRPVMLRIPASRRGWGCAGPVSGPDNPRRRPMQARNRDASPRGDSVGGPEV